MSSVEPVPVLSDLTPLTFKAKVNNSVSFLSNFYPDVRNYRPDRSSTTPRVDGMLFADSTGMEFRSVEHYFQYHKYMMIDPVYADLIRCSKTALNAKQLGGKGVYVTHKYKSQTGTHKVTKVSIERAFDKAVGVFRASHALRVMRVGLSYKFRCNRELKQLLLNTGERPLCELGRTKRDYWAHTGQNMLGRLLVELRTKLREEEEQTLPM